MPAPFIIIESLKMEDEKEDRFEGRFLGKYLKLCKFKYEYYYIRTKKELKYIADNMNLGPASIFISCHGNEESISTTLDEDISFREFAQIFSGRLNNKRVLGSFCLAGREKFAKALFKENNEMSCFIAPTHKVCFQSTYPFWITYCSLVNGQNVTYNLLHEILSVCSRLYNMHMAYYPWQWWEKKIRKPEFFDPSTIDWEDCETYHKLIKRVNGIK